MVNTPSPVARLLVLTEDSSADGPPTIRALLQHVLAQVNSAADLARVSFEPLPDSRASKALAGNVWKSAKKTATAGVVDLVQRIARHLALGSSCFVVHHIDGDRVWKDRDSSENVREYGNVVMRRVRLQLSVWAAKQNRGAVVDEHMSRLLLLTPFWCVEAWLFQNTEEAGKHCTNPGHQCASLLSGWKSDRSKLDEERTPKELLCFRDKHNAILAGTSFPRGELLLAGKSFAAAVNTMQTCAPLVASLSLAVPVAVQGGTAGGLTD